jgi:DNA-directed RNA polymerase subunit RPC12/RpoP
MDTPKMTVVTCDIFNYLGHVESFVMVRYVCPRCDRDVEAGPFRVTCPTCGGRLLNYRHAQS